MATYNWEAMQKQAEAGAPVAVTPGQYDAQITDAVVKQTKSNKDQLSVTWKIITPGAQAGQTVFQNIVISPENDKAMYMFFQNMANLGIPKTMFKGSFTLDQAAAMVKGKTGVITVENNPNPNDPANPYTNIKNAKVVTTGTAGRPAAVEV